MVLDPGVLRHRDRYERITEGFTDNTHEEAFTHTVRVTEPDRAVEISVVASPSPDYAILDARARALAGDVDPTVVAAVSTSRRSTRGPTRSRARARR